MCLFVVFFVFVKWDIYYLYYFDKVSVGLDSGGGGGGGVENLYFLNF